MSFEVIKNGVSGTAQQTTLIDAQNTLLAAQNSLLMVASYQPSILQAIVAMAQNLTIEQKAAMDDNTLTGIFKSSNNYGLGGTHTAEVGNTTDNSAFSTNIWYTKFISDISFISATLTAVEINFQTSGGHASAAIYSDVNGQPATLLNQSASILIVATGFQTITIPDTLLSPNTSYWVAIQSDGTNRAYLKDVGMTAYHQASAYTAFPANTSNLISSNPAEWNIRGVINSVTSGIIRSLSITKNANIGLRFWAYLFLNIIAGSAGSTFAVKICNSSGTPLHSSFVNIPSSEYSRIPLMRPVTLTATGDSQTVWNFTGLSNCDKLLNELGVLAKAIVVELALDGSNYTVLQETNDPDSIAAGRYYEDITNILAPQIKINGTGVVNTISKLRATYIVNIPLSNTTIKLLIKLTRLAATDTSPSIQPFIGDPTNYVSAGQVALL